MAEVDRTLLGVRTVLIDVDRTRLNSIICQTINILLSRQRKRIESTDRPLICIFCASNERKRELICYAKRHLPVELQISIFEDKQKQIIFNSKPMFIVDTISSLQCFRNAIITEAKQAALIVDDWLWMQNFGANIGDIIRCFSTTIAFVTNVVEETCYHSQLCSLFKASENVLQCEVRLFDANRVFNKTKVATFQKKLKFVTAEIYNANERECLSEKLLDEFLLRMKTFYPKEITSKPAVDFLKPSFSYSPHSLLNSIVKCLSSIGPYGALVAAKKFKLDITKLIAMKSSNENKSDVTAENTEMSYGHDLSLSYQIACSVELYCLELIEGNVEETWRDLFVKVANSVSEQLKGCILLLCCDRLLCIALAGSLRFYLKNNSKSEDPKLESLIGHLVGSYSLDKTVQMVARQQHSDVWFEFGKGKFKVMVVTYDELRSLTKRHLQKTKLLCFEAPQSVEDLALLFRTSEQVKIFHNSSDSFVQSSVSNLIEKVKIISPYIKSKYCYVSPPSTDDPSKTEIYQSYDCLCVQLDAYLKKQTSFQILKRHQDKLPKDTYYFPLTSINIDTESGKIKLFYSRWRTDVKQCAETNLPDPDLVALKEAVKKLSEEVLQEVILAGEIDGQTKEVYKRSKLIRHVIQDLNQEEDEDILLSIEADTTTDSMMKGHQGSKKRRRVYPKSFPSHFTGKSLPTDSKQCFFYTVDVKMYKRMQSSVKGVNNSMDKETELRFETDQCYGILTSVPFPGHLPTFTVHTREGEEEVSISLRQSVWLSDDEIDSVEIFHQYVFNEVLRIEKDVLLFDPNESPLQYYVVLASQDEDGIFIDFQLMSDIIAESQIPFKQQHPFKFKPHAFQNAVVSPIYRKQERPHRMYVVKIRNDLNPLSEFPRSSLYETYSDYYRIKYGADITNLKQPLLEVEYTNLRLNLLTTRFGRVANCKNEKLVKIGGMGDRDNSGKEKPPVVDDENDKQFFVPELCYIWPIAAPLWKKTVCLPSILYRLEQLLVSHSVQVQIMTEALLLKDAKCLQASRENSIMYNSEFEKNCFDAQTTNFEGFDVSAASTCVPSSLHVLQCLTMASCTDVTNLERVETIGDSFLKYVTSVSLALSHQDSSSGELSVRRCRYISNENLFKIGVEKNFPGCIYYQTFDPSSNWLPPAYTYLTSEEPAEMENEKIKLNFSEAWSSVETGVWSDNVTASGTANMANADPDAINSATYRLWSQNSSNQQGGLDWGALDVGGSPSGANGISHFVPTNGTNGVNGINGLNGSSVPRNGGSMSSPFGVFSLSDDLLSSLNQSEMDQEIEDLFLDPEGEILSPPVIYGSNFGSSNAAGVLSKSGARGKTKTGFDKSSLPSPYMENCLSDKSIADVIESLIGCYFVQSGSVVAFKLMKWLSLPVVENESAFERFQGNLSDLEDDLYNTRRLFDVEKMLQYEFNHKRILIEAFTHPTMSDSYPSLRNYQQLEFIGDAVLDFIITKEVFFHPRYFSSGAVTDMRAALVNNIIFASLAAENNLHKYILHKSSLLFNHIDEFIKFKERNGANGRKSENSDEQKQQQFSLSDDLRLGLDSVEELEVPKPLGDVFESLAAAVYIDSGFDLNVVWRVLKPIMWPTIELYAENIPVSPMRELMELKPGRVTFERMQDTMDHKVQVRVTVAALSSYVGIGINLRAAKCAAAQQALNDIKARNKENSN